jgi:hypothetical protein
MTHTDKVLPAHSLAEAYLYLMATPCAACGKGPLAGSDPRPAQRNAERLHLVMRVACGACGARTIVTFDLPAAAATPQADGIPEINPTDEPSRIIDVAQWLTLFRSIVEAAGKTADKKEARRLGIEAAGCLEEALKFYDDEENDLPPASAMFHAASRERFRNNPEQFSRRRIVEHRAKLPALSHMRDQTRKLDSKKAGRKPWWKLW